MTSAETIAALRSVTFRYALGCDTRNVPAFPSAFHPDGTLAVYDDPESAEPTQMFQGHERIGRVPGMLQRRYARTHHMLGQQEFVLEASGASGWVYCTARHLSIGADGTRSDLAMYIRYDDLYAPGEDGQWRLTSRKVMVDWTETVAAQ